MMKFKYLRLLRNELGISITQLMLIVAILGAMSAAGMKIFKHQSASTSYRQSLYEESGIMRIINLSLSSGANCAHNFQGKGHNSTISTLELSSGAEVFGINDSVANRSLEISAMRLIEKTVPVKPGPGFFELHVDFKRLKEGHGSRNITNKLDLIVNVDNAGKVVSCFSRPSTGLENIMDEACQGIGGTYNGGGKSCFLSNDINDENNHAVSKFYFQQELKNQLELKFIELDKEVATLYIRKDIPITCPAGKVIKSIINGTAVCITAMTPAASPATCTGINSRIRYQSLSSPDCPFEVQTRSCNDGVWGSWSGSFSETSCTKSGPGFVCPIVLVTTVCNAGQKVDGIVSSSCTKGKSKPICKYTQRIWDTPGESCAVNSKDYKDTTVIQSCNYVFP